MPLLANAPARQKTFEAIRQKALEAFRQRFMRSDTGWQQKTSDNAPAIAIMALIGGFLSPILLRSDRDQYRSLFGYIAALDLGALALLKHWPGLGSLAFDVDYE